jgi:hypothetical protein
MLTRDTILSLDDLPRREVYVPEWKDSVCVRALTGAERATFERIVFSDAATDESIMAKVVALCAVDGAGARLFTEEDVAALNGKNAKALHTVAQAALAFNALTDGALEEGKDASAPSPG